MVSNIGILIPLGNRMHSRDPNLYNVSNNNDLLVKMPIRKPYADTRLPRFLETQDHLDRIKGGPSLPARAVVDSLNAAGILSGRGKAWTVSGIRRPLAMAKKIITDRARSAEEMTSLPNYGRFG